jgi:L-lysine exporter family protein LysE/ArgO
MITLAEGLLLGFGYVMPIGAQNLYVVHSSINNNFKNALRVSSLVIFMDISLAMACFFGAGLIFSSHLYVAKVIQGLGGIYLLKLASDLFKAKIYLDIKTNGIASQKGALKSAFVLTWLNPQALFDGSLLLGGIRSNLTSSNSVLFILGVCTASITWFYGITIFLNIFKSRLKPNGIKVLNIFCGLVLAWFGIKLIANSLNLL